MTVISHRDLAEIRKRHKNQKIVFCSGGFDLTHAGHVLFLEDCKKLGDILLVSVSSDRALQVKKTKERPILNEQTRLKMISALKPVDYCFLEVYSGGHLLSHIDFVLENLKPDIYVINEDAFNIPYRKKLATKHNVKMKILKRWCPPAFEDISTTKIIEKIKKNKS